MQPTLKQILHYPRKPQLDSSLLNLPFELRLRIYEHVVVSALVLKQLCYSPPDREYHYFFRFYRHDDEIDLRLLQTCSQVAQEAWPIFFKQNLYTFERPGLLTQFMDRIDPCLYDWLLNIVICEHNNYVTHPIDKIGEELLDALRPNTYLTPREVARDLVVWLGQTTQFRRLKSLTFELYYCVWIPEAVSDIWIGANKRSGKYEHWEAGVFEATGHAFADWHKALELHDISFCFNDTKPVEETYTDYGYEGYTQSEKQVSFIWTGREEKSTEQTAVWPLSDRNDELKSWHEHIYSRLPPVESVEHEDDNRTEWPLYIEPCVSEEEEEG